MAKLRKMLGAADSPYIISLMSLIETQSKTTIVKWCVDYAEDIILPIYEKRCTDSEDMRLRNAIKAARDWLDGTIKLAEAKKIILKAQEVARELEDDPIAQAAARAIGQAPATVYKPTHSLGLAFYGAAAIAYDRVGTQEKQDVYEQIAAEECAKMELALRHQAVENEINPVKVKWYC